MIKLVVDPRIVVIDGDATDEEVLSRFWSRLVEWAADQRVVVGVNTYSYVWSQLDARGYPEKDLEMAPRALRNEYRSALNKILSQVQETASDPVERTLTPDYTGTDEQRRVLVADALSMASRGIRGIATCTDSWLEWTEAVSFDPLPPKPLALCDSPLEPIEEELRENTKRRFAGSRLHIVGGQPSEYVVAKIKELTGIGGRSISWLPSEKSKPPRDLDKRWKNLRADRDIAICVTGRIGHASALAAETAAKKAGVTYIEVETVNEIVKALS